MECNQHCACFKCKKEECDGKSASCVWIPTVNTTANVLNVKASIAMGGVKSVWNAKRLSVMENVGAVLSAENWIAMKVVEHAPIATKMNAMESASSVSNAKK